MWSRNIRFNKSNVPFCTLKRNLFLSKSSGDIVIPGSASARLIIDFKRVHDSDAAACLYNRVLYSLSSASSASCRSSLAVFSAHTINCFGYPCLPASHFSQYCPVQYIQDFHKGTYLISFPNIAPNLLALLTSVKCILLYSM